MLKDMQRYIKIIAMLLMFGAVQLLRAEENKGMPGIVNPNIKIQKTLAACEPANSKVDLDINNVRTTLLNGGDMWWDLSDAKYEIPKVEPGSGKIPTHSLFAGALWIGGIDEGNQLKVAAQTYRQSGNDFWPGPLTSNASTDDITCKAFDRHWKINRTDIDAFIEISSGGGTVPISSIPKTVLEWPGRGNPHARGANNTLLNLDPSKNYAPFVDVNLDLIYNPEDGDFPSLEMNRSDNIPDQMIWWINNDKGDIHSETGGEAIGLELQTLAFGFSTNDEINDMTFYKTQINNYSTSVLDSVYFGQWVDADLGYAFDDFVGCDTSRDLGICYNGDAVDGPASNAYGANPPLVGVDFFQGPKNELGDTLGMSKFIYYNNDFTVIGNPEVASHFYGYLSGSWKNGSPVTFGGNGFQGTTPTDFMFPDDP